MRNEDHIRARVDAVLHETDGVVETEYGGTIGQLTLAMDLMSLLTKLETLREALARAAYVADHLMSMIPADTWRGAGGDDGQGHYEGEYWAAQTIEEIKGWTALAEVKEEG